VFKEKNVDNALVYSAIIILLLDRTELDFNFLSDMVTLRYKDFRMYGLRKPMEKE
jgi:hypothetical protein